MVQPHHVTLMPLFRHAKGPTPRAVCTKYVKNIR